MLNDNIMCTIILSNKKNYQVQSRNATHPKRVTVMEMVSFNSFKNHFARMAFVMNYLFVDCEMIKEKHHIISLLMGLKTFHRKLVDQKTQTVNLAQNN